MERRSTIYEDRLDERSVRLLRIRRDRFHSETETWIQCELSTHARRKCPPYVSLSYAWHDEQVAQNGEVNWQISAIIVNEQEVTIQKNLLYAIQHLASHQDDDDDCYYWVDALCIDQADNAERTSQVSIMHNIYRNATKVLVWLGPDPDNEAETIRGFFRALLTKYYTETDFQTQRNEDGECIPGMKARLYEQDFLTGDDEHNMADAGLPPLTSDIWAMVIRFWERSWFGRVWVQQEVALAQEVDVWCGDVQFSPIELVEASRFFIMSGLSNTLLPFKDSGLPAGSNQIGRLVGASAVRFDDLHAHAQGTDIMEPYDFCQAADRLTGPYLGFEERRNRMLRMFAVQLYLSFRDNASEPKDKVFALLVLMKQIAEAYDDAELPLRIDYSRGLAQVYREAAAWVIESSGWLGLLGLLWRRRTLTNLQEWPSWVPDFRCPAPRMLRLFAPDMPDRIAHYFETMTPETRPQLSTDGLRIAISAKRIGIVAEVGSNFESMIDDANFEETSQLLLHCPLTVGEAGRSRIDEWMDVLSGDDLKQLSDVDRRAAFKHWLGFFILRKMSLEFREGRITRGREFFWTRPLFEELAKSDASNTLPTWQYWMDTPPEQQAEILRHRPAKFATIEIDGRRLFRLEQLGFPHCPSATLIGLGPEGIQVGDEVFAVAGAPMPLVLRHVDVQTIALNDLGSGAIESSSRHVLAEAFMSGFDDILDEMRDVEWKRFELV